VCRSHAVQMRQPHDIKAICLCVLATSLALPIGCHRGGQHEKRQRAKWTTRALLDELRLKEASGVSCGEAISSIENDIRKRLDPWGRPYHLQCGIRTAVISGGPDGLIGTEDDLSAVDDPPDR
jgi:hypothetical protein